VRAFIAPLIFIMSMAAVYNTSYSPKSSKGYIECYLSGGDLYFSDKWVGRVRVDDNVFIFKSEFKDIEVKVSGPCISQEESENGY